MANKLSIDGVIFVGKSDISSWTPTPIPGGIKVQWTPSDIEILSGSYWYHSSFNGWQAVADYLFSLNSFPINFYCEPTRNTVDLKIFNSAKYSASGVSNSLGTIVIPSGYRIELTQVAIFVEGQQIRIDAFHKSYCNFGSVFVPNNNQSYQFGIGRLDYFISSKRVTSNTGEFSERETTITPDVSLLAGSCGLVVNYADGSQSPILEFPQCPQDVFLVDDEDQVCQNACNLANSIINKLG